MNLTMIFNGKQYSMRKVRGGGLVSTNVHLDNTTVGYGTSVYGEGTLKNKIVGGSAPIRIKSNSEFAVKYIDSSKSVSEISARNNCRHVQGEKFSPLVSELESRILKMRFGIAPYTSDYTLQQIADQVGVTRERIRQIESRVLNKIRKNINKTSLGDFVENWDSTKRLELNAKLHNNGVRAI